MSPLNFRRRLFVILSLFAVVPAVILTIVWAVSVSRTLPSASAAAAWERVAQSGETVAAALTTADLTPDQRRALQLHEGLLSGSVTQARRLDFVLQRAIPAVIGVSLVGLAILWIAVSRVAGHLSRQLSRPLQEIVGWTALIEQGQMPPEQATARGAPEFETLRQRMRSMAHELARGREQAVESERLTAFRETARRVAHELKNPLTPMQFAIAGIRRTATDQQAESLRVLEEETARLERMARSFAQFGKLPDARPSLVDLPELLRSTATACVPSHLSLTFDLQEPIAPCHGDHDALQRAVMNVVLNAVDACGNSGAIRIALKSPAPGRARILVEDSGPGIAPEQLHAIWRPYVTTKREGTGLGLAIAEQVVLAHGGQVGAESTLGTGTRIWFDLPLRTAVAEDSSVTATS